MNTGNYRIAPLSEKEIEIINKAQSEIAQKGCNVVLIAYDRSEK